MVRSRPAFRPVISGSTIAAGFTFRKRMPNKVRNETRTPEASARTQRPIGMKRKKMMRKMPAKNAKASTKPRLRVVLSTGDVLELKEVIHGRESRVESHEGHVKREETTARLETRDSRLSSP